MKKHAAAVRSTVFLAVAVFAIRANADTLLWYRFDGDGATVVNRAKPGTMDGTLKSINKWATSTTESALSGLGDDNKKFPTRGDAFPEGTRLIDPATDTVYNDTVKSLSFSGDPANSGTVLLLKANATTALKEMMSCTCEVFFKLPSDSAAIETRRAKDILFPLVDWGSPDGNGQGWFFGLRKDNSTTGFYPFFRSKHNTTSSTPTQTDVQQKVYISDANWHHMALRITADSSANKATVELLLDYTVVATGTLNSFYGFHYKNGGNFPFLVGADLWRASNGARNCCFMGEIAEVRVSDTALATDKLLKPYHPDLMGPIDVDTLVYLPMVDMSWFGSRSSSKYYGLENVVVDALYSPEWLSNSAEIPRPQVQVDSEDGRKMRAGYLAQEVYPDISSMRFFRKYNETAKAYYGHVIKIPYESMGLTEGSFTLEWFFKTDGQIPSGNEINSYTFLNNTFGKIMINQANGKLLTRLVKPSGKPNYEDFNSTNRVDDAQWHHYALVYDKLQGEFAVYLDYRLIASKKYSLTTETGTAFCFGGEGRYKQAFSGWLDDFRITKRALRADEFLTTRERISDAALFAKFEGDYTTGQDVAFASDGVGGTLGGGSEPTFVDVNRRIDIDGDGKADYTSTKALSLDGGSVVYPHNLLLESRDFTAEWFAKYESLPNLSMILRFGEKSEIGNGTMCWALYTPAANPTALRMGAYTSIDGTWERDLRIRSDKDFEGLGAVADGKWHHWALVAETHPDATPANTTFRLYRDYKQVGNALVYDGKDHAGGILALPSTGTTLSIGTSGNAINGVIDDLRITPKVLAPEKFMCKVPGGLVLILR